MEILFYGSGSKRTFGFGHKRSRVTQSTLFYILSPCCMKPLRYLQGPEETEATNIVTWSKEINETREQFREALVQCQEQWCDLTYYGYSDPYFVLHDDFIDNEIELEAALRRIYRFVRSWSPNSGTFILTIEA